MDMRRKDREISDYGTCEEMLRKNRVGCLGTVSEDGMPYVVPMNYFYKDGYIYLHSAMEGHKIENIKTSSKVAFTVIVKENLELEQFTTKYASIIAFGEATFIEALDEKIDVLNDMLAALGKPVAVTDHFKVDFIEKQTRLIKIKVTKMTGKSNIE